MRTGDQAFHRLVRDYEFETLLDVGCGEGAPHATEFRGHGKKVTTVDHRCPADVQDDYVWALLPEYDAIWCCHVLEHQVDAQTFLTKLRGDLKPGGILALTVPPLKHEIVGGHVSLWNAGLLVYRLVLAGFDCRVARIGSYGYNISVLVERRDIDLLPELNGANGDLEALAPFFPDGVASQDMDGRLPDIRW